MEPVLAEDNCVVLRGELVSVIAMYARPAGAENTTELIEKLVRCLELIPRDGKAVIAGDFNVRLDKPDDSRTIAFTETLSEFGFWIANDPTMFTFNGPMGSSTIDLFATNLTSDKVEFQGANHPLAEGERLTWHVPVGLRISVSTRNTSMKTRPASSRRLDQAKLLPLMRLKPATTEDDVAAFSDLLTKGLQRCTKPRETCRERRWWNENCTKAKRAQIRLKELCKTQPSSKTLLASAKTLYRRTLKQAKAAHQELLEQKLLKQAESAPHVWLQHRTSIRPSCPVLPDVLQSHFRDIVAAKDTVPTTTPHYASVWPEIDELHRDELAKNFSITEVHEAIARLPARKACGPDGVYNEHLKASLVLTPQWTSLFNACLAQGKIPDNWRECTMIVIPKGKGRPTDPSSWRGISKKSCIYKLLSNLLVRRLTPFLEFRGVLPDEQHGFRTGRSTISACEELMRTVEATLARPGQALYSIFVDFKAAFDTGSRSLVMAKLAESGVPLKILELLRAILQKNMISIDDGVVIQDSFEQTTGFAQGDNISPLLFSVLIGDLPSQITTRHPLVKVILYADDLVMFSTSRHHLQQAIVTLTKYVGEVGLTINNKKTEALKFRRGGRLAATDELRLNGLPVKYVNSFTYLGITLTVTGTSFRQHVEMRVRKALVASSTIEAPHRLSIDTALRLFNLKVAPAAAYGVQLIWQHLSTSDFAALERVKPAFLKRVLGMHSTARNRLVYLLTGTSLFVADLRQTFSLEETEEFKSFVRLQEEKMAELDPDIFTTPAMTNDAWKGRNRPNRHVVVRFSVHGYHHHLCRVEGFHDPGDGCQCKYCSSECPRYHALACNGVRSLNQLACL